MKKQQILDIESPNNAEFVLQQVLINYSNTEIIATLRVLRKLDKILYKSWAKSMPLNDIHESFNIAQQAIKNEEDGNKVEN